MIINTNSNTYVNIPSNSIYTPYLVNNLYNIPNCVSILGNCKIYQLSSGLYLIQGGNNNVLLPSIFTTTVINNIYQQWYEYYMYNDNISNTQYNAVYIDSSNNVYLGFYNGTQVIGLQFLSGSTSINKQGVWGNGIVWSTGAASAINLLNLTYYAQHSSPTATMYLWTNSSSIAANAYFVIDGTSSSTFSTTSTSAQTYTYSPSISNSTLNRHNLQIYAWSTSGQATAYVQFVSFA